MRLNKKDIRLLLDLLGEKTVVGRTNDFPYTIRCRGIGYSDDPEKAAVQAKLSVMLEAAKED